MENIWGRVIHDNFNYFSPSNSLQINISFQICFQKYASPDDTGQVDLLAISSDFLSLGPFTEAQGSMILL